MSDTTNIIRNFGINVAVDSESTQDILKEASSAGEDQIESLRMSADL